MNILVISSILPIPDFRHANDFIFQTYKHYQDVYKEDRIVIINPVRYDLNLIRILKRKTRIQTLKGMRIREIQGFHVEIIPFVSLYRFRNLHSLVTRSAYHLNKKRFVKLFSDYNFDVIHTNYIFSDGILAYLLGKKYRVPYLINTHNEKYYFQHVLSKIVARKILNAATYVLPLNYSNYLYFKTLGIQNLEHTPLGFTKSFLRDQRMKPNKIISIFTVSELIKLKNIHQVLYALESLKPSFEFTYTIIGRGPEKENLENLVEKLGLTHSVKFIGYIPHDQISDEMHKHDIFIMPSFFETFGRVYFEVMAMGIPVICANNSGIYGVFEDRIEGLAVDHTSIPSIADALEYLISDDNTRLQIGRNGQELVKNYTWENIAARLHSRYEKSIAGISTED